MTPVCNRPPLFLGLSVSVPRVSRNGLEGVLQRSLRPAFDDHVCFVATVRLAKPQFIKARTSLSIWRVLLTPF